jgi:KaiC/GvpD/RAD55 family RecA-like ATPase
VAENGLLQRIAQLQQQPLPIELGRNLVCEFLEERTAVMPVMNAMAECTRLSRTRAVYPFHASQLVEAAATRIQTIRKAWSGPVREPILSLGAERAAHEAQLQRHRGRILVGFRTGVTEVDQRTCGLRGVIVLSAAPGVGKTVLALQLAVGVCRHRENDAVVVYLSLDMHRHELYTRVRCSLAEMDWTTLVLGSQELRGNAEGPWFNPGHQICLQNADRLTAEFQLDRRLTICDRSQLGLEITADKLARVLADAKAAAGAPRALLVLDYLNLIEVPEKIQRQRDALEADKYRVRLMQDVAAKTRTTANPDGDAILFISEARKPASSKEDWGALLADIMGSSRVGYAVDGALMYRRMTDEDLPRYYGLETGHGVGDRCRALRQRQEREGISPVVLGFAKGRDGMTCGEWGMEFHFRRSVLAPLPAAAPSPRLIGHRPQLSAPSNGRSH